MEIDGADVLVSPARELEGDRRARLFLTGVLGAIREGEVWRCPSRSRSASALLLHLHNWFATRGIEVAVEGVAEAVVAAELQRRRSFERTERAAREFRANPTSFDYAALDSALADLNWSSERALFDHQRLAVAHALVAGSAANFSVPGSGKTVVALATAAAHLASGTIDVVLVIGPLSSFHPWETECAAAVGDAIRTSRVRGTAYERRGQYARVARHDLLLMSYATAAHDQMFLTQLMAEHRTMLVVDESHRIKRFQGGTWAPAITQLAKGARVRMILSGTPMPRSGLDLYSQLNVLWPDGQLTGSRQRFSASIDRSFDTVLNRVLPFTSRTPKSALGLRPYEIHTHAVELNPIQASIYDLIETRFRAAVADAVLWKDKINSLRAARPLRLIQAASNPLLLNARDEQFDLPRVDLRVPGLSIMEQLKAYGQLETAAKIEAALDLIAEMAERGEKVVCWSNFLGNLDQLALTVAETLGIASYQVDGRVPAGTDALRPISENSAPETDTRETVIERFLDHRGPAVLAANPASCSESISLHRACRNALYVDRTFDAALWLQSIDRIHRLGLPPDAEVNVHVLIARRGGAPTIDEVVDGALHARDAQMRRLLEGADLVPLALSDDAAIDAEGTTEDLARLVRYLLGIAL